jgi:cyclic beta-1,2-glucan synthetase
LESFGLVGRYGFCEAADFTPARVPQNHSFMPVKCYMSHHLGMSLLAIDNLLNDNIMTARFMSDPEMSAYGELLEEKIPTNGITMKPRGKEVPEKPARNVVTGWQREFESVDPARPRCVLLSNGSYTLFCTDGGLTASTLGDMALTRFEPNTLKHGLGWSFFLSCDELWASLTPLPAPHEHMMYSTVFGIDSVSWNAENAADGIRATVTARVPNGEGAEQRSVLLHNSGKITRNLELYSYFEPVLSPIEHYDSHPAFSKLFLQSEIDGNCINFHRRARSDRSSAHMTVACDAMFAKFDTSRELVLSRGGASGLRFANPDYGTQGSVLDPCALIRVPVKLDPGSSCVITFSMAAAGTAPDATAAAIRALTLEDDMASSTDTMNLLRLTPAESHAALDWLTDLVFISETRLRQAYDISHNTMGQNVLWQWGISGDLPIVVAMGADAQPERLSRLLRMYRYLSLCGMQFDFVVLTQDGSDYRRPQRAHISETLKAIGCEGLLGGRAGVHIIDASSLSSDNAYLLMSSAALVLDGAVVRPGKAGGQVPVRAKRELHPHTPKHNSQPPETRYLDDGSFQFDIRGQLPRAAWGHTLANNAFGALIRDTGFGHIWRQNARENKLTPWDNDPLAIHGDETMCVIIGNRDISPFADLDGFPCTVTYGFGYAVYEKDLGDDVRITATVFVPSDRMARLVKIDVFGAQSVRLKHFTRLVMGSKRSDRRYIVTEKTRFSLTAHNAHNTAYNPQKIVLSSLPSPISFTCDVNAWNADCIGGQCGAGLEPCFATITELMPQGEMLSAVVVLGAAQNEQGVALIENLANFGQFGEELERTKLWWRERVCSHTVNTPSSVMNHYLNGWALYQVIANRLFARASFYQCGGAYGFRDQLQDVCAVLYTAPQLAKNQILRACAHQFEEGDVQHWWHPSRRFSRDFAERGVRTRISDDLLWLPYTVCEYIDKTGDSGILEYTVPYLTAEPLSSGVHDRFEVPRVTEYRETVFKHCIRAIERVITRGTGVNGLLLILGGDWNDGFDRVGADGRGESTWLTWFAAHVFERFADLCGNKDYAQKLRDLSVSLGRAADNMWDGAWYKRGTFDNGTPLGSSQNDECRIDSIAQSFSALSPQASHTRKALESAYEHLVKGNIIKLFTPPFDKTKQNPGYIKGYLPGVRENGGQYTHAAVWLAMGHFLDGQYERGLELLEKLLPENHGSEYIGEPHVLAADVYSNPEHFGRGGWTHYTGAAAWYYRVAIEHLEDKNKITGDRKGLTSGV